MAYQAITCGARGLMFFGGHLTQTSRPADASAGWNWTFWELALRPLLEELSSTAVAPALVAADGPTVKATATDVDLVTRRDGRFLYVLAARRGGATSRVGFTGLPKKLDGSPIGGGQVLFEYVQEPPPPPIGAGRQTFRSVSVANGSFRDWFGPHTSTSTASVSRFAVAPGRLIGPCPSAWLRRLRRQLSASACSSARLRSRTESAAAAGTTPSP